MKRDSRLPIPKKNPSCDKMPWLDTYPSKKPTTASTVPEVITDAVTSRIGTAAGAEVTLSHTAGMMLALTGVQALCLAGILYLLTGYLLRSLKDAPGRSRR